MPRVASPAEGALRTRIQTKWRRAGLWFWANNPDMLKGIPDTQGVYQGMPFFVEWKAEDGTLMKKQEDWLKDLARNGGLALEVRANTSNPYPWYAEYRIVSAARGLVPVAFPIVGDRWLQDFIERIRS